MGMPSAESDPVTIDFEQLARKIMQLGDGECDDRDIVDYRDIGWGDRLDKAIAIVRQVWNARGAADAAVCVGDGMDRIEVLEAIKALDR